MSNQFSLLSEGALLQGRYRVKKLIGKGGMGAVYEARAEHLGHAVALKQNFFGGDDQLKRAFEREARLLANLRHPALPRVTDYFTEDFGQFLVMEFVAGDDLMALLKQRGNPFPVEQVLLWADQLLDALRYLHTQEPPIIHRDLKPQNLKPNSRGGIMLLDFGLAKGTTAGLTSMMADSSLLGYTPGYAPLEQMSGKGTDERSDLYALAATLYHLLTNQAPPDAMLRSGEISVGEPDPLRPASEYNPNVPLALSNLLLRAMAQKRDDRPRNASEMLKELAKRESNQTTDTDPKADTVVEDPNRSRTPPWYVKPTRPEWAPTDDEEAAEARQIAMARRDVVFEIPAPFAMATQPMQPSTPKKPGWLIIGLAAVIVIGVLTVITIVGIWLYQRPVTGLGNEQTNQALPAGQTSTSNTTASSNPISIDIDNGVKIDFVLVPTGSFQMGSDKNDDEKPLHKVALSKPFHLGKYEVTQAQWQSVMGNNPSSFKNCGDNCPVDSVSWDGAQEFLKRLNAKQNQYTFRLPTEAEWEYAARAGTNGDYAGNLDEMAWYYKNSDNKTHSVGGKKPNAWGLYDMHGNVWEWVQDWYDKDYYKSGSRSDPQGPSNGQSRVLRGGSWYHNALFCRSADRNYYTPGYRLNYIGFRLVCVARTN